MRRMTLSLAGTNFFLGAIAVLGFAPFNAWPYTLLSFSALLVNIHNKEARTSAKIGFFWGVGFYSAGINWLFDCLDTFGNLPIIGSILLMILLICYLSLFPALFSYFSARFLPQSTHAISYSIGIAIFWFISEWIRSTLFTGFPWLLLGYSQTQGPLQGFAPLIGVRGISFILCLSACALSYLILGILKRKIRLLPMLTVVVFTALFFTSNHYLKSKLWVVEKEQSSTNFALIQGNIPQEKKWLPTEKWPIINTYTKHTIENLNADIIVWPEAAIPAFEFEVSSFLGSLDQKAKNTDTAIISGVLDFMPTQKHYYNNVIVLGKNGTKEYKSSQIPRYTKHHLTPFGEFVPLEPVLKMLSNMFNLPFSSFSPGKYIQKNLIANGKTFATAMCYEIIFDQQVRDNVHANTDYILTVSNDTWFGSSIGPLQHMQIAQMRSRELQKPLIRATNNGVTAVTNALGDITEHLPQFNEMVLKARVTPTQGETPFNRYGYWPLIILSLFYFIYLIFYRTKNR